VDGGDDRRPHLRPPLMPKTGRKPTPAAEFTLPDLTRFAGERLEPDGDYLATDFVDLDLAGQDAPDVRFLECRLLRCGLDGASLRRARIAESLLSDLHGAAVDLADSTWRDSQMSGGRLGAVTLTGATWTGVRIRGSHLGFMNLAGSHVQDVLFEGCEIGSLDARGAEWRSVAFVDCRVDELEVAGATLAKVDLSGARLRTLVGVESLRGAIVSHEQLVDLAPLFAAQLGLEVRGDPPSREDG
jgi:uncharacterized protein YjbI with pentapeptide repeats